MISSVKLKTKDVHSVLENAKAHKKALMGSLSDTLRRVVKADEFLKTEAASIIITAIGTGLVAPIFIANNPLANSTDEETKKYSALRQPVSAVIAVLMQLGITIPFNNFLDRMANEGKLGSKYDKSGLQDKKYLRKKITKENPGSSNSTIVELRKKEEARQTKKAMEKLAKKGKTGDLLKMVTDEAEVIAKNVKGLKNVMSLIIGVATIPISCTLLNWAYPKFVEKFFPHLCKDDEKKEGQNDK